MTGLMGFADRRISVSVVSPSQELRSLAPLRRSDAQLRIVTDNKATVLKTDQHFFEEDIILTHSGRGQAGCRGLQHLCHIQNPPFGRTLLAGMCDGGRRQLLCTLSCYFHL